MLRFSCYITENEYDSLRKETPRSKKKVVMLANLILIPVILWTVNSYVIAYEVMHSSINVSLLAAILCGLIVFILERTIVISEGNWKITAFRILLGILIALTGSLGWDHMLFNNDIHQQLTVNRLSIIDDAIIKIDDKYAYAISQENKNVNEKYHQWQISLNDAKKEADGTAGSGHKGVGQIASMKMNIAVKNEKDYINASNKLNQLNTKVEKEKEEVRARLENSFKDGSFLLGMEAMFDLISGNRTALVVYIIITSLIFSLEMLVIIFKITSKKTNHERRQDMIEWIGKKRMDGYMNDDKNLKTDDRKLPAYINANEKIKRLAGYTLFL